MQDGGPAFPFSFVDGETGARLAVPGMTLRDWFAGQALIAIQSDPGSAHAEPLRTMSFGAQARSAYAMADAMLAARERTS